MPKAELLNIIEHIRKANRILITSHISPDGDAIGSVLAMRHVTKALTNNEVVCVLANPVPQKYAWLSNADCIRLPQECEPGFDLAIILDVAKLDRIGSVAVLITPETKTVVLDHHLGNEHDGDIAIIDSTCSAAGEFALQLLDTAGLELSRDVAEYIYVSLTTDTGGFRYSNTTEHSHHIAARLVATGLNLADISRRVFDEMPAQRFRLLAHFIHGVELLQSGQIAIGTVTMQDLKISNASEEDVEGLINFARNISGVKVAMVIRETGDGQTKVSMRSSDEINAAELLSTFGGGGHAAAAGATFDKSIPEIKKLLLERIVELLGQ